jgi:propionyl-CoA carboxylase alpha chain
VKGNISTAFTAQEYPNGFAGAELPRDAYEPITAAVAAMHHLLQRRETQISGTLSNHQRTIGTDWMVKVGGA